MGKQWKQWQTLFSWAPKSLWMVTAAMKLKDACFLEAKLSLIRQHIKKQRHCFADKDPYSQSYGFPAVMYGCEKWTIKKAEHQKIDAFELWCWRRLLKIPWTAKRSNQSILKEINSEYSFTLATWCKEPTHWKRPWCWERLRAGGEGSNRGWDGWMASPTQWPWVWANSGR